MSKVIVLFGKKGCGKDTIAKYLQDNHGFVHMKLAQPLREIAKTLFLWDEIDLEENKEKIDPFWGISYRDFATVFGTEFTQDLLCDTFPDYKNQTSKKVFSKALYKRWERKYKEKDANIIISDHRFPHEQEYLKKMGAYFIKVVPTNKKSEYKKTSHSSESFYDELHYDGIIINDFSQPIKSLYDTIDAILGNISV